MNIGIDKLSFYVPNLYVDMTDLAHARDTDPNKFHIGIGQDKMAVSPVTQDIVTLGANAAAKILSDKDKEEIDMVIVGTESSYDFSKASAVAIHRLLGIQPFARSFEIKEACYGATAALQMAKNYIAEHPTRKVLVIAADLARYGLNSGGEPTQGAGAIAILVTSDPRILTIENDSVFLTEDIYDFWRPSYADFPLVDGPLSNETYIQSFGKVWNRHKEVTGQTLADYDALCFHIPYTKMGKKALLSVLSETDEATQERLMNRYEESITYSRNVGNLYTGSLFLGLISLLDISKELDAGSTIGLFSYGSGAVSEFFTVRLVEGYKEQLAVQEHQKLLENRRKLAIDEYEEIFTQALPKHGEAATFDDEILFSIEKVENDIRFYKEN
ncbi:hydroxymethylglutaryl-CoA synthase [Enterococcus sp. JM4C]|uniref:hydroxymethylglutaryl-CoA synthase n=1 Tax=Candidatus Enterococcus huntleyi TaxID=1857217 RepID=UPI00137A1155|nr:hydroxymethylglutaryl-CoA synthase [Enterococcus sp. JM4C]KAF1298118.1 hydroxymethylglutaryl-CoA synthase [Enterococcus sp. JM4C]